MGVGQWGRVVVMVEVVAMGVGEWGRVVVMAEMAEVVQLHRGAERPVSATSAV